MQMMMLAERANTADLLCYLKEAAVDYFYF